MHLFQPPRRAVIGLLLACLVVAGCAKAPEPLQVATRLPETRSLPNFALQTAGATPLTPADLRGHPTLLFFGFSSCPDLCPTTLTTLASAVRHLDDLASAEQPMILFVSVDPRRDTPALLADYAVHFGDRVQAATADPTTLDALTRAVGAHYAVPADADPARGYAVEHSGQVYVLNADGQFMAVFSPPHDAAIMAADLRRLFTGSGTHP
jgi:protein SCO1/2